MRGRNGSGRLDILEKGLSTATERVPCGRIAADGRRVMAEIVRVGAEEVRPKVESGETLLVCAYEEDGKFRQLQLSGATSLSEFQSRLPSLPRSQEIVFYCA